VEKARDPHLRSTGLPGAIDDRAVLTVGSSYTLSVQAINAVGTGAAASGTVTMGG
jgi:hypothetical protein